VGACNQRWFLAPSTALLTLLTRLSITSADSYQIDQVRASSSATSSACRLVHSIDNRHINSVEHSTKHLIHQKINQHFTSTIAFKTQHDSRSHLLHWNPCCLYRHYNFSRLIQRIDVTILRLHDIRSIQRLWLHPVRHIKYQSIHRQSTHQVSINP
jgi:hypothetical protein